MDTRKEASDSDRLRVFVALKYRDGRVEGESYGDVARQLHVKRMSITHVKRTLGSLAHSNTRSRQIAISRHHLDGTRRIVAVVRSR